MAIERVCGGPFQDFNRAYFDLNPINPTEKIEIFKNPPFSRDEELEGVFGGILQDDRKLKLFCSNVPKSHNPHEHLGPHPSTIIEHADKTGSYFDLKKCKFTKKPKQQCIQANVLNLQDKVSTEARKLFYDAVTLVPSRDFSPLEAANHFFNTFRITGSIDIPLEVLFVDAYLSAKKNNLQSVLWMVDLPFHTKPPEAPLPTTMDSLTDEVLNEFSIKIEKWVESEVSYWSEELKRVGELARVELGLEHSFFGFGNPVYVGLQVEIIKCFSLSTTNPNLGELFSRISCEVFRALKLEASCPFIKSSNFAGPEHHTLDYEDQIGKIIDYFYRLQGAFTIAYHAGELSLGLVTGRRMEGIAERVFDYCHPRRIGHATCLTEKKDLRRILQEDVAIEVCMSACEGIQKIIHPFNQFIKYGIPCIPATDNENVFLTNISLELLKMIQSWNAVTYLDIKNLQRNGLHFSDFKGDSIFERIEGVYCLKSDFIKYIESEEFDPLVNGDLSEKQIIQILYERNLFEFEEEVMLAQVGSPSNSPPKHGLACGKAPDTFGYFAHLYKT